MINMKKILFFLFLSFSFLKGFSQVDYFGANKILAGKNFRPPQDTTEAPLWVGEIRTRVVADTAYSYICISRTAPRKWSLTGKTGGVSGVSNLTVAMGFTVGGVNMGFFNVAEDSVTFRGIDTSTSILPALQGDGSILLNLIDGTITSAKLAPGVIPTSLPPNGTANGDLNGTYPNPTVDGLQGRPLTSTAPTTGQVIKWNGSAWAPGTDDNTGGGGSGWGLDGNATSALEQFGTTSNQAVSIITNNVEIGRLLATGEWNIGMNNGTNANLHVAPKSSTGTAIEAQAAGTGASTYLLRFLNSSGTFGFAVSENMNLYWGSSLNNELTSSTLKFNNPQATIRTQTTATSTGNYIVFSPLANLTATSGTADHVNVVATIAPTSGTAVYNAFVDKRTINQTGGASGSTRGFFANPTVTAAADYIAFEAATGRSKFRGLELAQRTITATSSVTHDDHTIFADATSASLTVNLLSAALCPGKEIVVKKTTSANTVTIDPASTETIDGVATLDLTTQYSGRVLKSNGTNWLIVGTF